VLDRLGSSRTLGDAFAAARRDADFATVDGLRVPLLLGLLERRGPASALLAITATSREADAVRAAVASYAPGATVLDFPAWETLPHERLSPSAGIVGTRLRTLRELRRW